MNKKITTKDIFIHETLFVDDIDKHQSFKKDPHYDWVEKEIERKKNSSTESLNRDGGSSSRLIPNPERHLISNFQFDTIKRANLTIYLKIFYNL